MSTAVHGCAEVREAAKKFDAIRPDWFERVDPKAIDLASEQRCVGGQAFGGFYVAVHTLGLEGPTWPAWGEALMPGREPEVTFARTDAWAAEIYARRAGGGRADLAAEPLDLSQKSIVSERLRAALAAGVVTLSVVAVLGGLLS